MPIPDSRGESLNQKVQRHPDGSKELWRDVPCFEKCYRVSDRGRVKSLPRSVIRKNGAIYTCPPKFLKAWPSREGYLSVLLCKKGIDKSYSIHRLVLETFVGPCPEGMECRHYPDRDPSNNGLENLQWGTRKENIADAIEHGTHRCCNTDALSIAAQRFWDGMTPDESSGEHRRRRYKQIANSTYEQRSESARKAQAKITPEQRAESNRKGQASITPEERRVSNRKRAKGARRAWAKLTPEQRRERALKAWIVRKQKQNNT